MSQNETTLVVTGDTLSITLDSGFTVSTDRERAGQILLAAAIGAPAVIIPGRHVPNPGEMWESEQGIYLGSVVGEDGRPDYHLIQPTAPEFFFDNVKLGTYGNDVKGARHRRDGLQNTIALAEAGSDLAMRVMALGKDVYLPAQLEAYLSFIYAPDAFEEKDWHWTSTQYSAHYAFGQDFLDGLQHFGVKNNSFRARAVRRFVIR